MKTILILTLFIFSWQTAVSTEKYGVIYFSNLNNGLTMTLYLFNNGKYLIYAATSTEGVSIVSQDEISLGRYKKKKDSIIFIDEISNYRFSAVFVPGYPFGQRDLEIYINNNGDFFKVFNKFACLKSDYDNYKNKLKDRKKRQKKQIQFFYEIEKAHSKGTFKFDYGEYNFFNISKYDDAILKINKDNSYTYSLYGAILSEGNFKRKGDVVYLIDNRTKAEYKAVIIGDNEISAVTLPLFLSLNFTGKLNNEKQSERKKQENGFFRK